MEAEGFWRAPWEDFGSGNESAEWLEEIQLAINWCVPPSSQESWTLEIAEAVKVISKKRNWSVSNHLLVEECMCTS